MNEVWQKPQMRTNISLSPDVLVIGAGPAGAISAYELSKKGRSVVIVDVCEFPRDKVCAGALTKKTIRSLPFDIDHLILNRTNNITFKAEDITFSLKQKNNVLFMVERISFDKFLLDQAVSRGATFYKVTKNYKIIEHKHYVTVVWEGLKIACKTLIAADGSNSSVRRMLSSQKTLKKPGFAIETNVKNKIEENESQSMSQDDFFVSFNKSTKGYFWGFNKGNCLNLGLYSADGSGISKSLVEKYILENNFEKLNSVKGAAINHKLSLNIFKKNIIFVGDAAGLADPIFGEGIYAAVESGRAAALAASYKNSTVKKIVYIYGIKKILTRKVISRVLYKLINSSLFFYRIFYFIIKRTPLF